MSEFEQIAGPTAEQLAVQAEEARIEAIQGARTRAEAISFGEALAKATAAARNETGQAREQRIARAKAYAAWEWDGKPEDGNHLAEFGVSSRAAEPPVAYGADWKREKEKKQR